MPYLPKAPNTPNRFLLNFLGSYPGESVQEKLYNHLMLTYPKTRPIKDGNYPIQCNVNFRLSQLIQLVSIFEE